jgi:aspartyl-tRNA(Asn)/glutamyl-tRNA(Gln) amidotransferase subunit C
MKVDEKLIDDLAHLARLEFEQKEKVRIQNDLERMIGFVNKLNEINTDSIEPLIYMTEERNVLRDDEVIVGVSQKDALKNAPQKDSDYFKVPKVISNKS